MKRNRKTKFIFALKKTAGYFALYGLIPLICGGIIGLLLFVRVSGAENAESLMANAGEITLSSLVGGAARKDAARKGFYFLSGEITPPVSDEKDTLVGNATYFSFSDTPEEKAPATTPDVVYDSLPAGATPIISCDLSSSAFYINTTKYTIDVEAARNAVFPSGTDTAGSDPLVLVLHTHGTEGYFEDHTNLSDFAQGEVKSYFIEGETSFRTTDPEKSVVRVGEVFSEALNLRGVPTLHCTIMHDKDDFNSAYVNSAETVKKMLREYPSIQYVIDLHRDSVVRGESYVKSYTVIEDRPCAQVMLVVGTGQNGRHPNWEQNLIVATNFKDRMDTLYPTLSRAMYLRTARFNQEYLPGCMLLEVGCAANTLEEAENAARYAAYAFADMIQNEQ